MAVIGKIRERSGLLLVIIGGALAAFILTDLFSGRTGQDEQVLGVVGGEEIALREFERRVGDELDAYRNAGDNITGQMTEQVRTSVWQQMVMERVMMERVQDAGFSLTKGEYDDIRFGENILPDLKGQRNFQGPDGQPDRDALRTYFTNVQLNAPVYHSIQKRRITENRLYAKYANLVKNTVFVNSAQARKEHSAKNEKSSFNFVALRYDSEPDSLYPVSDEDLRKFHGANKDLVKYNQKPSRKFEYALFPVVATAEDRDAVRAELEGMKEDLRTAENDSLFVVANSASRTYSKVPYAEGTADRLNDSLIVNAEVGSVIGPYADGDTWKLVKVVELADVEEARVRHILLSTQEGKDEAEQRRRADSVLTVVKRDRSKFEELVTALSDDPGSKSTGGVYEWFDRKTMVPEFTKASFDEKEGAITIAKTDYGFHIVEVLGQRNRSERRIVSIDLDVRPSPATFKEVYKLANEFSLRYKSSVEEFRSGAEERSIAVTTVDELRPDQRTVPGLEEAGATISWANRADIGDVSEPLDAGDNYVVSILTGIREEGAPDLEDVRELFTSEVIKQKKAEAFAKKMANKTDLNALATELGLSVQTANDLAMSTFSIPGGYSEYEVIGQIMALTTGQTSVPLKGESAVYVVNVTGVKPAPEEADLSGERNTLLDRLRSRAENGVFNALREVAGVKDDRSLFY